MTISKIKKHYADKVKKYSDWRDKSQIWNFMDELKWHSISKEFFKKGVVLDAGGGQGRWSIKLAKMGHDVILVDM